MGWILASFALWASALIAAPPTHAVPTPQRSVSLDEAPAPVSKRLSALAESAPTVEAFLEALKKEYPDHFNGFSSVFRTRSLHQATPEQPRIILGDGKPGGSAYGSDPSKLFYIAFSTVPSDPRFNIVEAIVWNPKAKRFEFLELNFSKASSSPRVTQPESCETCHGYPKKPIWDLYAFWPGVFGSEDDRYDDDRMSKFERAHFKSFVEKVRAEHGATSGRFRFLETKEIGQTWHRPNLEINHAVSRSSAQLIAKEIASKIPSDSPVGPIAIAAMNYFNLCENGLEDFFPPDLKDAIDQEAKANSEIIKKANAIYGSDRFQRGKDSQASPYDSATLSSYEELPLSYVKFLLDGASGGKIDLYELSANPSPKTYQMFHVTDLAYELSKKLGLNYYQSDDTYLLDHSICPKALATVRRLTQDASGNFTPAYRQQLKQYLEFSKANRAAEFPEFEKCASCHAATSTTGAPYIPFDNRILLGERLKRSKRLQREILERTSKTPVEGKAPMPPQGSLSDDERSHIRKFVGEIGK